jgi:hypothetical protein
MTVWVTGAYGDDAAQGTGAHRLVVLAERCAAPDLRLSGEYAPRQRRRDPNLWNQKLPDGAGPCECRWGVGRRIIEPAEIR